MKGITSWEDKKSILNIDYSTLSESEKTKILSDFDNIKKGLAQYDLCNTDEEYERALYSNLCGEINRMKRITNEAGISYFDFLGKLILKEYSDRYIEKIYPDVKILTSQAPYFNTLTPRQDLYEYRNQICRDNRKILDGILSNYFLSVSFEDGKYVFTDSLMGDSFNLDTDSHLAFILGRYNDLFDFTKAIDSVREGPVFHYDVNYWEDYALTLKKDSEAIGLEFEQVFTKSENGFEEVNVYKNSLDLYRRFAEGYDLSLNNEHKKKI